MAALVHGASSIDTNGRAQHDATSVRGVAARRLHRQPSVECRRVGTTPGGCHVQSGELKSVIEWIRNANVSRNPLFPQEFPCVHILRRYQDPGINCERRERRAGASVSAGPGSCGFPRGLLGGSGPQLSLGSGGLFPAAALRSVCCRWFQGVWFWGG